MKKAQNLLEISIIAVLVVVVSMAAFNGFKNISTKLAGKPLVQYKDTEATNQSNNAQDQATPTYTQAITGAKSQTYSGTTATGTNAQTYTGTTSASTVKTTNAQTSAAKPSVTTSIATNNVTTAATKTTETAGIYSSPAKPSTKTKTNLNLW